ncbi:MAG: TIGR01777 family protein [Lewinellaceae bacterium]|nr:TIGR01777 family oxidoreductase [Saprospiraceae bacterium]MCB9337238.1 TIGR01777 family protein [Lewinellaceae bacterium]
MPTILIAGGTGLVGLRLSQLLKEKKYDVLHLSRSKDPTAEFPAYQWDLGKGTIDQEAIEKADYIINLAGAGIADKPWTKERKQLIIDSRVDSTQLLKKYIAQQKTPPKAYIAASAVGYYGSRGDQLMKESDPPADKGFLAESVTLWENAIRQVEETGVRLATIRIGIVLSTQGGALEKILLPFKFFNGAYFGSGQQWMSWVHIDDLCRMFIEAVENEQFQGIYNGVGPHPSRNKDFVYKVKAALGKPALIVPAPEAALRLVMGEMADVVFESTRVSSEKIEKTGFKFQFPELVPALRDLLERKV